MNRCVEYLLWPLVETFELGPDVTVGVIFKVESAPNEDFM